MDLKPQPIPGGLLIIFDGIDGAGKSTQLELAKAYLEEAGWPVYNTQNLGGTPIGEALRDIIKAKVERPPASDLYISAAIQEALIEVIDTEREKGSVILMDRSPLSLAAYNIYGRDMDGATAWPIVDRGMAALNPDLVLIYLAEVAAARRRLHAKLGKSDYYESQPDSYFDKVAEGYNEAPGRYDFKTVYINANRTVDFVKDDTLAEVEKVLQAKLKHL